MKKLLLLVLAFATLTLNAQVYTHEFEGATAGADLESLENYFVTLKDGYNLGASPVFSDQDLLFYENYAGSEVGLSVEIDSVNGGSTFGDATRRYTSGWNISGEDTLKLDASQTYTAADSYYAAFLVKPFGPDFGSMRDIFQLELSPSLGNWSRARVFMDIIGDSDVQFGIGKKNGPIDDGDTTATFVDGVGSTYLLVVKYEQVAGENNDVVKLYVNPDPTMTEAEQTSVIVSPDLADDWNSSSGILPLRINVCQRGHTAEIGGIRVGKNNWEEVLKGKAVTGVSLDQSTLDLETGSNATLTATVTPEDAGDPSVSWSSSNLEVAIVVDGLVTGTGEGTATITVTTTDGAFEATCDVTVTDPVGISESSEANISIYPNPSTGVFTIANSEGADVAVFSVTGQLVFQKSYISNNELINANLTKGLYLVSVTKDDSKGFVKLIID
ncbi:Ig-like domain-containing protein [Bacteroidota bacterium]